MEQILLTWIAAVGLAGFGFLMLNKWYRCGLWTKLGGPRGWPFVGNALQMKRYTPHITLTQWAKKYGDMYIINLFGEPVVVVSSEEGIREVLVKKSRDFAGRPQLFRMSYINRDLQAIALSSYSQSWQARKKLFSNKLRMYGDGLRRLEDISTDIISDLIQLWHNNLGKPFDPKPDIHHGIINILFSLIFGQKLTHDDPLMHNITYYQTIVAPEIFSPTTGIELDLLPWLRFFGHSTFEKLKNFKQHHVGTVVKELIQERKKTMDPDNPRGLMDGLLIELMKNKETTGMEGNEVLNETSVLPFLLSETFGAGTQTTASTLLSVIGHCILNQDLQVRLRNHITDIIGDRAPLLEDRSRLPLVDAVIFEVLRLTSVIPTGIPHETTEATTLNGVTLPKGTGVWINLWSLHHDERYWEAPWEFRPDRYLDDHGQLIPADHPNRKRLLTFGAGQRVCPGEALAKNRLFLFVTSLIQHFRFLPADTPPNCDPCDQTPGIVMYPPSFSIIIEPVH